MLVTAAVVGGLALTSPGVAKADTFTEVRTVSRDNPYYGYGYGGYGDIGYPGIYNVGYGYPGYGYGWHRPCFRHYPHPYLYGGYGF